MFTLPILPPSIRVPLNPYEVTIEREVPGENGAPASKITVVEPLFNFTGCTAVLRPLSLEQDANWRDRYPLVDGKRTYEAQNALVKQQLLGIEGYGYAFPDGHTEAFDAKNEAHFQSMPQVLRGALYMTIRERAELSENTSGNSDSPSGSGGTSNTAASSAEAAQSESATS
jgi:hypothetical protein